MPNKQSAEKRVRKSLKQNDYNRTWKSRVHSSSKKVIEAINEKDSEKAKKAFDVYMSVIDKAAGKGVLHKSTAARKKSRLNEKLLKLNS